MSAEFEWKVRVYYEDTDAAGVVFYANYLRYMERARTEWLRQLGFEHHRLLDEYGVLFAVKKLAIDYIMPARLDELLTIQSHFVNHRGASINFKQQITNDDETLLSQAEVKVACLNAETLRPAAMPDVLMTELLNVD